MASPIKDSFVTVLLCILSLFPECFQAKTRPPETKDTANYDCVFEYYKSGIDFKTENNKVIIEYSCSKQVTYLNNEALKQNTLSFFYSDYFSKVTKRKAFVEYPKLNGKFKTKRIEDFVSRTVTASHVFYEDLIQEDWYFPNLVTGSKATLEVETKISDPVLTPRCYFNLEFYAKRIVYTMNVPDFMKIKTVIIGDTSGIKCSSVKTATSTVYTYSCTERLPIVSESNSLDISYYVPHLIIMPIQYTLNKTEVRLCGTVDNLFSMYNNNIHSIVEIDQSEPGRISDSLTKSISDTLDKIKAIYRWVQKNIQYIAFEEGTGGFIPRAAGKTLHNRYGDCKDKSNLLIHMLRRAGVPSYYTWIGTRKKPYEYTKVPSPHADDHMIVAVRNKGEWIFLDATAQDADIECPSSFIQGKQALVRLSDSTFNLVKVPILEAETSIKADTINISISNGIVSGKGSQTVTGYIKEEYANLKNSNIKADDEVIKKQIKIGNNKVVIKDFQIKNISENRMKAAYTFNLPNYVQNFNDEIYLNMNLIKNFDNEIISDTRTLGYQVDYKYVLLQDISLDLSDDKEIVQIPKNYSYKNNEFSYELSYERNGNNIKLNKHIVIDHLVLEKGKFKNWNEMIETLSKAYSEVVVIKQKP